MLTNDLRVPSTAVQRMTKSASVNTRQKNVVFAMITNLVTVPKSCTNNLPIYNLPHNKPLEHRYKVCYPSKYNSLVSCGHTCTLCQPLHSSARQTQVIC